MAETHANIRKRRIHQLDQGVRTHKQTRGLMHSGGSKSYLDALPSETLENIIRFTSDRPYNRHWHAHISPQVALQLLMSKSVFATCARGLFRAVTCWEYGYDERETTGVFVVLPDDGNKTLFPRLVSALRDKLTEVKIDFKFVKFPVTWRCVLKSTCPNLKRLTLSMASSDGAFSLSEVLAAQGAHLEFLKISGLYLGEDDVTAIANFARHLKGLDLQLRSSRVKVGHVWESIGNSLEELFIRQTSYRVAIDFPFVKRHCKNLRKLSVCSVRGAVHHELEQLCTSRGNGLTSLTLKNCSVAPERLGRIAAVCKKAAIELMQRNGCTPEELLAIGANAHRVNVGLRTVEGGISCFEALQRASEKCRTLAAIRVVGYIPRALLEALLVRPKPLLVEFKAYFDFRVDARFVIEVLAQNASSLQEFEFCGRLPEMSVLQNFIDSNRSLRTIKLTHLRSEFEYDENRTGELAPAEIVRMLFRCPKLEMISVSVDPPILPIDLGTSEGESYAALRFGARCRNIDMTTRGWGYS